MSKKITIIKFFVLAGNFLIPLYAFFSFWFSEKSIMGFLFFLFISSCIIERAWETFSTSKERHREELHGDWTLAAVTGSYLILFAVTIWEFYTRIRQPNFAITVFGLALLGLSFRLRFWGMAALGKQWAVHAVGVRKIKQIRIIKLGPYRYIRHPIYSGIIMELVAFPIIANASLSLLFAFTVCIPMVIIRAFLEERSSLRRFGQKYKAYQQEVGMFLPTQLIRRFS